MRLFGESVLAMRFVRVAYYLLFLAGTGLYFRRKSLLPGFAPAYTLLATLAIGCQFAESAWEAVVPAAFTVFALAAARGGGKSRGAWTAFAGACAALSVLTLFLALAGFGLAAGPARLAEGIHWTVFLLAKNVSEYRALELLWPSFAAASLPFLWGAVRLKDRRLALLSVAAAAAFAVLLFGLTRFPELRARQALAAAVPMLYVFFLPKEAVDPEERHALLFYSACLHYLFSRADLGHILPGLVALVVLLPSVRIVARPRIVGYAALAGLVWVGGFIVQWPLALAIAFQAPEAGRLMKTGDYASVVSAERSLVSIRLYPEEAEREALLYLREKTGDGPVYVGLGDHTLPLTKNLRAAWLIPDSLPTRYPAFEWGVTTDAGRQAEIIREIEERNCRWALLWTGIWEEEARQRPHSKVRVLEDWMRANFRLEKRFGPYVILYRPAEKG